MKSEKAKEGAQGFHFHWVILRRLYGELGHDASF